MTSTFDEETIGVFVAIPINFRVMESQKSHSRSEIQWIAVTSLASLQHKIGRFRSEIRWFRNSLSLSATASSAQDSYFLS